MSQPLGLEPVGTLRCKATRVLFFPLDGMLVHRKLASGILEISVLIDIQEVPEWTTVHSPGWRKAREAYSVWPKNVTHRPPPALEP